MLKMSTFLTRKVDVLKLRNRRFSHMQHFQLENDTFLSRDFGMFTFPIGKVYVLNAARSTRPAGRPRGRRSYTKVLIF